MRNLVSGKFVSTPSIYRKVCHRASILHEKPEEANSSLLSLSRLMRSNVIQADKITRDVEMPGKTGFDLVSDLKKLDICPCIIFQTAFLLQFDTLL